MGVKKKCKTNANKPKEIHCSPKYELQLQVHRGRGPEYRGRGPEYRGRSPEYRGRSPEYRGRSPEFRGRSPEYRGRSPEYTFFIWTII